VLCFVCGPADVEIIHFQQLSYRVQLPSFSRSPSVTVREKTVLKDAWPLKAAVFYEFLTEQNRVYIYFPGYWYTNMALGITRFYGF
jgi:hypothetical protein